MVKRSEAVGCGEKVRKLIADAVVADGVQGCWPNRGFDVGLRLRLTRTVPDAPSRLDVPCATAGAGPLTVGGFRGNDVTSVFAVIPAEDIEAANRGANDIAYPLLLKASAGGGGRGMRVVNEPSELESRLAAAGAEAQAAFSDSRIYMERYFPRVHHVEVQVFGDRHGNHVHLGERDCSAQRRHQKLVEESPSPVLTRARRDEICDAAVQLACGVGYENAGTVEFIYDPAGDRCYFIEMNTRIQVEHPVTEMVTGTDLVREHPRGLMAEPSLPAS